MVKLHVTAHVWIVYENGATAISDTDIRYRIGRISSCKAVLISYREWHIVDTADGEAVVPWVDRPGEDLMEVHGSCVSPPHLAR